MTLNPQALVDHEFPEREHVLSRRDASLYALGIGLGEDPLNERDLAYLFEGHPDFCAVPTQAVTMGFFRWVLQPEFGIDVTKVVHGEERLTLPGPVPTEGTVRARLRVVGVTDKGAGRGALVSTRREIRMADSDAPFAIVETTTFCRGDGGCGSYGSTVSLSEPVPDRLPDHEAEVTIPANAALLYRLSGDYNPLHVDPAYAARAGFPKPILHGLCTFAIAARTIWSRLGPARRIGRIGCRFSAVVYPGDRLKVQTWETETGNHFRALSADRVVLDAGSTAIADT